MHASAAAWQHTEGTAAADCAASNHDCLSASACGDAIFRVSLLASVALPCELQVVLKMGQIVVEDVNIKVGPGRSETLVICPQPWAGRITREYNLDFLVPSAHTAIHIAQPSRCHTVTSSMQCAIDAGCS